MKKPRFVLPIVLVALLVSCSQKKITGIEEIPLPPEAREKSINGSYEAALDRATGRILKNLKQTHRNVGERILSLPSNVEASEIFEFYNQNLGAKDFASDASGAQNGGDYRLSMWQKSGWLGSQSVAVAVIDAGEDSEGKPIKFLAVYAAEK